jgi:hypothetical protein
MMEERIMNAHAWQTATTSMTTAATLHFAAADVVLQATIRKLMKMTASK